LIQVKVVLNDNFVDIQYAYEVTHSFIPLNCIKKIKISC